MNLSEISNSIYVINLPERTDRKTHILSELEKIELKNFELVDAINGNNIHNPTNLKNGMYGLVLTYLKIYEKWKKNVNDNILIIEDDCIFFPDFNRKLKEYIDNVPKDWEMLYFGGNHNYHVGSKTQNINDYCIKLNNTYSAHCVILKNYVFEELIKNLKEFRIENDVMLAFLQKKYNAYSSKDKMTTQMANISNIENKYVDYNWIIK